MVHFHLIFMCILFFFLHFSSIRIIRENLKRLCMFENLKVFDAPKKKEFILFVEKIKIKRSRQFYTKTSYFNLCVFHSIVFLVNLLCTKLNDSTERKWKKNIFFLLFCHHQRHEIKTNIKDEKKTEEKEILLNKISEDSLKIFDCKSRTKIFYLHNFFFLFIFSCSFCRLFRLLNF